MPKSTATKKANTSKPKKQKKDEEVDHPKDEEHVDDNPAAFCPGKVKDQAPLDEKVSYE